MKITPEDIKKLRDDSGVGILAAKQALEEAETYHDALVILRKKGHATLAKKSDRAAKEGLIASYIHAGGKVGVLLELNCETDFVARNEEFKQLADEISLHIAASSPLFVSREEVPENLIDNEKLVFMEQAKDKPEAMKDQIVAGKLEKYYEQSVLLEQPYVRDPSIKIKDLVAEKVGKLGENIQVRRFVRFVLGAE